MWRLIHLLACLLQAVLILVGVAFFTLLEQKLMGEAHMRLGPNKVGPSGILQPFADAGKLLPKGSTASSITKKHLFSTGMLISLLLALSIWLIVGSSQSGININMTPLMVFALLGIGLYALLFMGWGSNSKYTRWGGFRGLSQSISYEVILIFILLSFMFNMQKLSFLESAKWAMPLILSFFIMGTYWGISILAETNRPPFDFSEGESELVSGFNTEYSSGPFAMIFMAEYTMMMTLSWMSMLLMGPSSIMAMVSITVFIWIRTSLPRNRYEALMMACWTVLAPMVILFISAPTLG